MDRIRENESENITVKSIVISVNYMVGFSSVEMPKEVANHQVIRKTFSSYLFFLNKLRFIILLTR